MSSSRRSWRRSRFPARAGLVSKFTQGWQVNGIFRYISGNVLTVNPGVDTVLNGSAAGNQRVNMVGSPVSSAGAAFNQLYLNTASFVKAPNGAFGNEGRNAFNGPGNWNFDASFFKMTRVTERAKLEYRFEGVQRSKPSSIWRPEHNSQRGHVRQNYHRGNSFDGDGSAGSADGAEAYFLSVP